MIEGFEGLASSFNRPGISKEVRYQVMSDECKEETARGRRVMSQFLRQFIRLVFPGAVKQMDLFHTFTPTRGRRRHEV